MAVYQVTTESGAVYEVTTDSAQEPAQAGIQEPNILESAEGLIGGTLTNPLGVIGNIASKTQGTVPEDAPGALFSLANEALFGVPRNALENPLKAALGGVAGSSVIGNKEREIPEFLKPKTQAGADLAGELGVAGMALPLEAFGGIFAKGLASRAGKLDDAAEALLKAKKSKAFATKKAASDAYGEGIKNLAKDNRNTKIDVTDLFTDVLDRIDTFNPKLKAIVERAVDGVDDFSNLTVDKAAKLLGKLKTKVRKGALEGKNVTPDEIEQLEFIDDFAKAISSKFPDEMAAINKAYGTVANDFKEVSKHLFGDSLEAIAKDGFKNTISRQAFKRILGEADFKELAKFGAKRARKEFLKGKAATATVGAGIGLGLSRLLSGGR